MISYLAQITFIALLTIVFIQINRKRRFGNNSNLISLSFIICLLLPLSFKVSIEVPEFFENDISKIHSHASYIQKQVSTTNTVLPSNSTDGLYQFADETNNEDSDFWIFYSIILSIWAIGSLIQTYAKRVRLNRLKKAVKYGIKSEICDSEIPVIFYKDAQVPFLLVMNKPYIVIPDFVADWPEQKVNHIISHEQCHYKRKDHLRLKLSNLIEIIFWFHPLIRFLSKRLKYEIEKECDSDLIKRGINRIEYAETLVEFTKTKEPITPYMSTKPSKLKERVNDIISCDLISEKKALSKITFMLMSMALVLSGCAQLNQPTLIPSSNMTTFISQDIPSLKKHKNLRNEVIISLFYDGNPNDETYVHLEIKNKNNEVSWLTLGPLLKFDEYIHTWHYKLIDTSFFTGKYQVVGVEKDGVVDGVALGLLSINSEGGVELFKSKTPLESESTPNFVCSWPLWISEEHLYNALPQITHEDPDEVARIICGTQLVQNGLHVLH